MKHLRFLIPALLLSIPAVASAPTAIASSLPDIEELERLYQEAQHEYTRTRCLLASAKLQNGHAVTNETKLLCNIKPDPYRIVEMHGKYYAELFLDDPNIPRYIESYRLDIIKDVAGDIIEPELLLAVCYGEGYLPRLNVGCADEAVGGHGEIGAWQIMPHHNLTEQQMRNFEFSTAWARDYLIRRGYIKGDEWATRVALGGYNGSGPHGGYQETARNRAQKIRELGIFN